jgi:hypothetical protein
MIGINRHALRRLVSARAVSTFVCPNGLEFPLGEGAATFDVTGSFASPRPTTPRR